MLYSTVCFFFIKMIENHFNERIVLIENSDMSVVGIRAKQLMGTETKNRKGRQKLLKFQF